MLRAATAQTFLRLLILQTILLATAQARTCYFTNGKEADSSFRPCFPDQDESVCCSVAKDNEVPNSICLTGGFCYVQDPYYRGLLRQGACTDSTWKSGRCPKLSHAAYDETLYVIPCPLQGRGFWCASNGTDCCHNSVRQDIGQMMNVTVTSFSGSISSYSSPSATSSTSPSPSINTAGSSESTPIATCPSDNNRSSSQKNTAVTAGVGAGLGACLLIALIALLVQRRIYTKRIRNKEAMIHALTSAGPQPHKASELRAATFPTELGPQEASIHEVEGNQL